MSHRGDAAKQEATEPMAKGTAIVKSKSLPPSSVDGELREIEPQGTQRRKNLISIIITNYNYARYIRKSIDSALNQSYPNKEVVVVDDGSTDDSREIINSYGNRIIPVNIDNIGQTGAANIGFNASRGKIVIFLDSDDYLLEGAVEALAKSVNNDRSIVKSQGYLTVVDIDEIPTGRRIPEQFDYSGNYKSSLLEKGLAGRCRNAYTSGNAWARWYLEQVMPLPEGKDFALDGCLNSIYGLFGKVHSIDQAVAAYRVHGGNKGPIGTVFTAESLKKVVEREEWCTNYLAEWANRLGHDVPIERWQKISWRRNLFIHCLDIMEDVAPRQKYSELVLSPIRSGHGVGLKAIGISTLLSILWSLPKKQGLKLARHMLKLQDNKQL